MFFSEHGRILEAVIPIGKEGRQRRIGFVRFLDMNELERMAIKLDNIFVEGMDCEASRKSPKIQT